MKIALYLQYLGESERSKLLAEVAVISITCVSWAHSVAGLPSPTTTPLVQATLGGLKISLAQPIRKKLPFTVEMLQTIVRDA